MSKISDKKGSFTIAVAALIVVLVVVLAIAAVLFLPVKAVNFNEYRSVQAATGVNKLNLKLSADFGEVRIVYTNLSGQALNLHVNAKGSVGYLMDPNSVSLDFVQSTSADTLIVNATVNVKDRLLGESNMNLHCDVLVDNSMRSKLDLSTSAGSIMVNTTNATAFDQIKMSAKAGAVTLRVVSGVSLYGDISLSTNLGASILDWTDPGRDIDQGGRGRAASQPDRSDGQDGHLQRHDRDRRGVIEHGHQGRCRRHHQLHHQCRRGPRGQ